MITIEQVQTLRILHDKEQAAYLNTFKDGSMKAYDEWVNACDELNSFIANIVTEPVANDYYDAYQD